LQFEYHLPEITELRKIIIAAVAENGVIGKSTGEMPWHVPEEFRHFKETTLGSPVIMGSRTFETLGKPLKGRLNIVVTNALNGLQNENDLIFFTSLNDALKFCEDQKFEKVFIIGGGMVYRQAISFADEMILSYMKFGAEGEVTFPEFDPSQWEITRKEEKEKFSVFYYSRSKVRA